MGKKCAVPGCNSGSAADIRQRKADDVRKCSTFGVPKVKKIIHFNSYEQIDSKLYEL